jgi:hypothetical protein
MLRKLGRQHAQLGSLELFAQLSSLGDTESAFRDSANVQDFLDNVRAGLEKSLGNSARLHGWRVQAMFEAMIVALGSVQLIKTEDTGDCYFDDDHGPVKVPDYRLIRADGEHLLVEVKNVAPGRETKLQGIRRSDMEGMRRYARLTGARLVVAHFWAAFRMWTVVDASCFRQQGNSKSLTVATALKANELEPLGDLMIATRPPLTISFPAQQPKGRNQRKGEQLKELDFKTGGIELSCPGGMLTDDVERRIAQFIMQFGGWALHRDTSISADGSLARLNFTFEPESPTPEQELQIVGQLSSMYSALWIAATTSGRGEITKLRHEPDPGSLANLIPRNYWEDKNRKLPLWEFHIHPTTATNNDT